MISQGFRGALPQRDRHGKRVIVIVESIVPPELYLKDNPTAVNEVSLLVSFYRRIET